MKKHTAIRAIEKQNKIIENMMKPYQNIVQNAAHTTIQTIDISQNLLTSRINSLNMSAISHIPQNIFQESIDLTSGIKKIILMNQDIIQSIMAPIEEQIQTIQSISKFQMSNYVQSELKGIRNLLDSLTPTFEWQEMYDKVSFEDIQELIDEEYLSDDFKINQQKINKLSDTNKEIISKKLHSVYRLIVLLQVVLGLLDSNTLKYLTKNVPIINHVFQTIHNSDISTDGHITKETDVYTYSSNSSQICGYIQYGVPFEVKEYHSGWLKIKYKNTFDEIKQGWILEDKAVWSFIKDE